jgi:hypothetical protein
MPYLDFVQAFDVAQALQASGWMAPADAWMLDDLARLIAVGKAAATRPALISRAYDAEKTIQRAAAAKPTEL